MFSNKNLLICTLAQLHVYKFKIIYQHKSLLLAFCFGPVLVLIVMTYLLLTHCILNRLSHTVYWKSPISNLGTPGYEILREKWLNYLQTVETLIRRHILRRLIWVCTVCQLPFYGSPDYNGFYMFQEKNG